MKAADSSLTFDDSSGSNRTLMHGVVPSGAQVLAVGGAVVEALRERDDCAVTRTEQDRLDTLGDQRFDVVLVDALEHVRDPAALLQRAQDLLADGGAVVASILNSALGSVRLAVLAGRLEELLDAGPVRLFTRESIEDLFAETGYVITHWVRERAEIEGSGLLSRDSVRELIESDPESTTYRFTLRAVPSDAAAQLAAAQAELRALQSELESLRRSAEDAEGLQEELEALRRAHEERGRRLVAERLEFANELGELQRHLEALHRSRSFRYTAVFRRFFGVFRGR
jgi:SAM-dependent methyltransferase